MSRAVAKHFTVVPLLCVALVWPSAALSRCPCADGHLGLVCRCGLPDSQGCCGSRTPAAPACPGCTPGADPSAPCQCEAGVDHDAIADPKGPEQNQPNPGIPSPNTSAQLAHRTLPRCGAPEPPPPTHNLRQSQLCVWLN